MSVSSILSPMYWDGAGAANYIRTELYTMSWRILEVDLSALVGVGAPYSGPIALRLDKSKLVKSTLATKWKDILLFSASGNLLGKVETPAKLLSMGWTLDESLVCVSMDGQVSIFDIEGKPKLFTNKVLSFGSDVRDISILDAKIYNEPTKAHTGVAVLTTQYSFYLMPSVEQENYRKYPDVPGLNMPPTCWCVYFLEGVTCILVSKEKVLYTLFPDGNTAENSNVGLNLQVNTFIACALSRSGSHLALMGDTGVVWLGSSDLKTKHAVYDTRLKSYSPKDFAWCGQSAVVVYDGKTQTLLLVDISGHWLRYDIVQDVILISEMDGLRIFSEDNHEMIQKIPQSVDSIVSIGSPSAGANLYVATKEFENRSAKSYDYLEEYRADLETAVDQCIQAALECYFPKDQEALLRAAAFGKCFISDSTGSESFTSACRTLRVLNNIRDPMIGVPLTRQQYKSLGVTAVVDRMIQRNLWPLAVFVCDHLQIPEIEGASRVKKHWACWKITQDTFSGRKSKDVDLAKVVREKLEKSTGISYAEIAKRAIECGRDELAIQLLNYETRSSQQIHLLIKLNRQNVALEKAVQSGDSFSIYEVILQLKNSMSSLEFQRLITSNRRALNYYMKYLKSWDRSQLMRMYDQNDDAFNKGLCKLDESYYEISSDNKINALKDAKADFVAAKAEIVQQLTEEQIRLYKSQQAVEDSLRSPKMYFGLSLHQYILKLVSNGRYKEADNVRKDFKMSEKKFWWIKIEGLAYREDFTELEKFSKSKKSPIGYGPFVEVCLKYDKRSEAERYVERVPAEERVIPYIRLGNLEKAAEQAFVNKSVDELIKVLDQTTVAAVGASTSAAQNTKALSVRIQTNIEKLQS